MAKVSLIDKIWAEAQENKIQQKESEYKGFLEAVKPLKKGLCIEIGRYLGASTIALSRFFTHVISVDFTPLPVDFPKLDNVDFIFADSQKNDTLEAVKKIIEAHNDLPVTCLFIDGDHSYQGCKRDFNLYKDLVAKGGKIVFHDILDTVEHRRQNCLVANVWEEINVKTLGFAKKEEVINDIKDSWGGIGIITV